MTDRIPSYRLHKATGQAVVTLSGRDFYLGLHGSEQSSREYERVVAEWLSHGRQLPTAVPLGCLSLAELFVAYLDFAKIYYSRDGVPTSEYTDMAAVLKDAATLYGRSPVAAFGPMALKAVRQVWVDRGYVRRRINQKVNRLRRCIKWGVENEFVPPTTLHGLQAVAPLKKGRVAVPEGMPVQAVSDADVDPVLPFVSRQVAAMIDLQRLTGMRPGEVVILRPCDVDRSGDVWIYRPSHHKTDYQSHEREIYIGPKGQEVLAPFLSRDPDAFCFSPIEAEQERLARRREGATTPRRSLKSVGNSRHGGSRRKRERYDRDSYRRAIEYGIRKAGVPHWHPHQLRHSCGTRVRSGFGLDAAQVILGHRTASVTEIYAAADREKGVEVAGRIG